MEGNYFCDDRHWRELKRKIASPSAMRLLKADTAAANPNGSLDNIAGICSEGRNVLGMMPHPDRSSESCWARRMG